MKWCICHERAGTTITLYVSEDGESTDEFKMRENFKHCYFMPMKYSENTAAKKIRRTKI